MSEQSARIYVVAGEPAIQTEITDRLTRLGYAVCGTAACDETAIGQIAQSAPDLVLIDIDLAGELDGIEIAARIRAGSDVAVVFLTASSDDELLRRAMASGPRGYLLKPYTEYQLHASIQIALDRSRAERAARAADRELDEREQRNAAFAQIGADWLWETDLDGRFSFFSDNNPRIPELSRTARIGTTRREGAVQDAKNLARIAEIEEAIQRREIFRDKFYMTKVGSRGPLWCSISGQPRYDSAGTFLGYRGIGRDVTELIEARRALEARNRVLDALLNTIPDGVSIRDIQSGLTVTNAQYFHLRGVDEEAARASPDPSFFTLVEMARRGEYGPGDPETLAIARREYNLSRLAEASLVSAERELKNGRWLESRVARIEGGGYLVLHRDITEPKKAELAIAESETRLKEAQRIARVGNWVTDRVADSVKWSETLYEIFGRDPRSAAPTREQYLKEIVFPEDETMVRRALHDGLSRGGVSNVDHRFRRPDGTIGWVHLEGRAEREATGEIARIRGTVQDITELKKNEIALHELNATLERRVEERTAALAESETRFRALFEQAAAGVSETDTANGTIIRVNRKFAEILGYEPEEIIGQGYRNLTHPDDIAEDIAFARKLRNGELREYTREKRFRRKDGRTIWVSSATSPLWAPGEAPSRHISVITDITTRHQTNVAMNAISTELVALDGQEYLVAAARKIDAVLGVDVVFICRIDSARPGQVETEVLIVDGTAVPNIRFDIAETPCADVTAGKPILVSNEAWRRYPNDALIRENGIESCAIVPLVENSDRIVGYLGIMRRRPARNFVLASTVLNIFAVAIAATMMRERSRREYRDLFEFAPDGLVLSDRKGRVVLVNRQAEAIFGWRREELIGQNLEVLVPQAMRSSHVALRDGFLNLPERRRMAVERAALRAQRKDGTVFPVEIDLAPVETDDGIMIAAAVRDITMRKKLEDQLAQATKMEAMGKLTGGMAHDFNNYLGVVIGNLDLLREIPEAGAEQIELIDAALSGAERGAELTRSLLAFSRQQPLDPRITDLNRRVETIVGLLKRTLGEDIKLGTNLGADLWNAKIDAAQLDSCIVNLANNARDAMPRGGALMFSTRNTYLDEQYAQANPGTLAGDYALIEVSDTGDGMPPEIVERVFEPFFSTKGPGHGTGLGLSMVYGFMKQSGGHIRIYSEAGHGTTVRLYLPRARLEDARAEIPAAVSDPARQKGTETILVVDDNVHVRDTVVAQLSSLGYRAIPVENADTALVVLEGGEPPVDLLFSDVVMPGRLDGYALAAIALERRPGIKVLMTSGFPGDALLGSGRPADLPLLAKPYRLAELAQALRTALRGDGNKGDGAN